MPPILYLVDGHALAYRTYFAMQASAGDRLQTSSGEPTAAIYGFINVLFSMMEKEKPEYLAVAFDTGKTFRHDFYEEYKATREKMPDDLREQIERIRQIIDAFDIPRLEAEGMEADDVLGTIANQAVEKGLGVKIITGDRDLLQLVTDRIVVNLPGRSLADASDYFKQDVIKKMGVRPDQIVDLKALMGDSSDNIPGVPGVGEKTAIKLLTEYETLDNIYAHIDEVASRFKNKLEEGKDLAYISQKLARIRLDVDIQIDLEKASTVHLDFDAVDRIFQELEFRTLRGRLRKLADLSPEMGPVGQLSLFGEPVAQIGNAPSSDIETIVVDTEAELKKLIEVLGKADWISFDTETTSTDPMLADLVGISLSVDPSVGYYIPVGHVHAEKQLSIPKVIDALTPAMTNPKIKKLGHNLKYDGLILERNGLKVTPYAFDTMLAGWLINPASYNLGLKAMAEEYLGVKMTHIEDLIGSGKSQLSMAVVEVQKAAAYAAADAAIPLAMRPVLEKEMKNRNAEPVFEKIEMPLVPVLAEMEMNGIQLDRPFFKHMSKELGQRRVEIEDQVYQIVGYQFNLNSTQQLSVALFETLGLKSPQKKKTASGHYSTNAAVLEQMQGEHRVVDLILEYRELAKLQSTYVDALPTQINPLTGRVHTSFSQTGSVTGRLSSINPNLQNIPTRTELGRKVRCGFVAEKPKVLVSVDYSQIELRIVAHMSQDEAMLNAFRAGQDIHATTAAAIYDIPLEDVTKEKRRHAKAINFGLIYGMSAFGLSRTTDLTLGESENFVKAYFERFPKVKAYLDNMRRLAAQQGYVETLSGRRRYFPNLAAGANANVRNREEREAINAPIQGTAADIMKIAMIQLSKALQKEQLKAKLILQVHDEVMLECPEDEVEKTVRLVQDVMENAYHLDIPLETEARWGSDWGSLQPIILNH
ncbi:MAG: DNA polymerase I [Anaerolineaceae bacterium]|nr:DNA polymerase I [Anaerolineaceae bacterium]